MARLLDHRRTITFSAVVAVCALSATPAAVLADEPVDASEAAGETSDPLEPLNRTVSGFNRVVRGLLLDPMVEAYKGIAPPPVQETVSNVTSNLQEPITAVSSALQGDSENAGNAMNRFLVNTTVGLAGTNDVASEMGIEARKEDLGQAMGANGMGPGPHIVLPIVGPSNMRDATGDILTSLTSPVTAAATAADSAVTYADNKDDIDAATKSALDPYVVERDGYEQHREYQVQNGDVMPTDVPTIVADD